VETLQGHGPQDLTELSLALATRMMVLGGKGEEAECRRMAENAMTSGAGFAKFREMVAEQGGDVSYLDDLSKFPKAAFSGTMVAETAGYLTLDAYLCGTAAVSLGAGRLVQEEGVDHAAGVRLYHKEGEFLQKGEPIAELYAESEAKLRAGMEVFRTAALIQAEPPEKHPLIYTSINQ
jgi:pyrimidine-nucleoside phosphorylase